MSNRRGVILLDAIVALAIVSVAAAALLALAGEGMSAQRRAADHDRRIREASHFLGVVSLWPREDLDARLGSRRQGPWTLVVQRQSPRIYVIALSDTLGVPLLRTAVFRRETHQ